MDPNRNMEISCANEVDDCRKAYNDFHFFIKKYFATDLMGRQQNPFEQGLLFDIHGQSHEEGWIELGYLLSATELNTKVSAAKSSIRRMASLSQHSFEDLLRGKNKINSYFFYTIQAISFIGNQSLGSILQNKYNYDTVPSPKFKSPNGGNYFNGGFISSTYGSKDCSADRINAIQIELPFALRANAAYLNNAKNLANAIYTFYTNNNFGRFLNQFSKSCV